MIFLWKLIKNSFGAIRNLKKLWLQAKFSNFLMPLVPIKNELPYSHNKWDKQKRSVTGANVCVAQR